MTESLIGILIITMLLLIVAGLVGSVLFGDRRS